MIAPVFSLRTVSPAVEEAFGAAWRSMARAEGHRPALPLIRQIPLSQEIDDDGPGWSESVEARRDRVYRMHSEGLSPIEIAARTGVDRRTVYNDLTRRGVESKRRWRLQEKIHNMAVCRQIYDAGGGKLEMVAATGRSWDTIKGYLADLGITLRAREMKDRREDIKRLRMQGLTCEDIAQQMGLTARTVQRECQAVGLGGRWPDRGAG